MIAANGVVGGSNPLNAAGGILHYHIDAVTGTTRCGCMLMKKERKDTSGCPSRPPLSRIRSGFFATGSQRHLWCVMTVVTAIFNVDDKN